MADIRIKDLTTTASSTASDDFIAVDGTTNGTRKLNAFSPTFGGNATVTGTLSSGGNLSVTGTSAQVILGQASSSQLTYLIRGAQAGGAIQIVQDALTVNRWLSLGGCDNTGAYSELLRVSGITGNIQIPGTSSSTSTSSGALVVGNGTQGGLGVGGAIYAGDTIETTSGSNRIVLGATNYIWHYRSGADGQLRLTRGGVRDWDFKGGTNLTIASDGTTVFTLTSTGNATVGGTLTVNSTSSFAGLIQLNNNVAQYWLDSGATQRRTALVSSGNATYFGPIDAGWGSTGYFSAGTSLILRTNGASGTFNDAVSISTGGNVSIASTSASLDTSSGALVVSGGVGVAGAIYAANLGGTSTNNNAASGCIGEYAFATTAYASKVSLTSNTAANIVLISLTAGDWDVQFNPVFTQDTPLTTSGLLAGVSSSSATLPSGAAERAHSPSGPNGNSDISIAPPVTRISLASTTTIYGVATGIFSAGTMSAYGFIRARRVR